MREGVELVHCVIDVTDERLPHLGRAEQREDDVAMPFAELGGDASQRGLLARGRLTRAVKQGVGDAGERRNYDDRAARLSDRYFRGAAYSCCVSE